MFSHYLDKTVCCVFQREIGCKCFVQSFYKLIIFDLSLIFDIGLIANLYLLTLSFKGVFPIRFKSGWKSVSFKSSCCLSSFIKWSKLLTWMCEDLLLKMTINQIEISALSPNSSTNGSTVASLSPLTPTVKKPSNKLRPIKKSYISW
jgi:hypothetical protein